MAGSDKIKKDDVLSGLGEAVKTLSGAIGGAITEIEGLIISQKKLAESINIGSSKELKELSQTLDALTKLVKTHNDLLKQKAVADKKQVDILMQQAKVQKSIEDAEIKAQKRKQEALKTLAQEAKTKREQNKLLQDEQKEKDRLAKIESKLANEAKKLSSEYAKQSAHLNKIRSEYKDLNTKKQLNHTLTEKEIADLNRLEKEVRELDAVLKKVDADAGQFQRNVGNYTDALSGLTDQFGALGGKIEGVITAVKNLGDSFGKMGTVAKAGAGPVVAVLGILSVLVTKIQGGVDSFSKQLSGIGGSIDVLTGRIGLLGVAITEAFKGNFTIAANLATVATTSLGSAMADAYKEGVKIAELKIDLEKDLIKSKEKIELLTQAMDDAKRRADDATLSFATREKESKAALQAELELREFQLTFAKRQLENIRIENAASQKAGTLRREDLEKEAEAAVNLLKAEDELGDAREINEQANRERRQKELKNRVEDIRQAADAQESILKKQIEDEKKIFDERRSLLAEWNNQNTDSFDRQIEDIEGVAKLRIDKEKLIQAAQNGTLDTYIRTLDTQNRLFGDKVQDALRTTIIGYIKTSNELKEEAIKLDKEQVELNNKLLELETERQALIQQGVIDELDFQADENVKRQEKIQEDLLKNENAFNNSLIDERKRLHEETMGFLEAEFIERKKLLELQFQADIAAVDHSSASEEEKDAKKLIIQEKYNQDTKKLEREKTNAINEESKREIEALKEQEKAQFKIITDTAQEITGQLEKVYGEVADKRQEDLDNQIDRRKDNIDKQIELAEKGADNQLAFEEAQLAKEELLKVEQQRKDEFNKKIIAYWNLLASYAEQNPDTALAKTIKTIGIAEGARALFNADIPSKFDGTEDTGEGGNLDSKGGKLFILHPHERVVTAEQNKLIGDIPNKDLAQLAYNWRTGVLHSEVGQESFGQNLSTSIDMMKYANMIDKKLDKFVQAVQNIEPTHVHLDNLGQVITEKVRNGILKREINVNTKSLR